MDTTKPVFGSKLSRDLKCVAICLFGFLFLQSYAADPIQLSPYLKKTTTFHFESLDAEVPLSFYYITNSTHSRPNNIGSPVFSCLNLIHKLESGINVDEPSDKPCRGCST